MKYRTGNFTAPVIRIECEAQNHEDKTAGGTEDQIRAHLYTEQGSVRTRQALQEALHASGLGIIRRKITEQLRPVRGEKHRPSSRDDQIRAHLRNQDGSLRKQEEILNALHDAGLGAANERIAKELVTVREVIKRPSAEDHQILPHLRNKNGSLRTQRQVAAALPEVGLGAANERIADLINDVLDEDKDVTMDE